MQAIHVKNDSRQLYLAETPSPILNNNEVLIKVRATAVNRADLLQRRGLYPPPPGESEILGLEAAGEIIAIGAQVFEWQVGDRVFCLLAGGGYAKHAKTHYDMLLPIPNEWSYEQAAAVPEVFYTAFVNLFLEARLKAGEILLLHAGASGVGTAAIQLARHAGALVIITAGSEEKIDRCLELGANHGIDYKTDDFERQVMKLTNNNGVDVILDCVGGSYLSKNLSLLKTKGRLVLIGLMGGGKSEIDLTTVLRKRLQIIGSVLRSRSLEEKITITRQFREKVLPRFKDGSFKPVIDSTFPLAQAEQAHAYVASNRNVGKVILRVQ